MFLSVLSFSLFLSLFVCVCVRARKAISDGSDSMIIKERTMYYSVSSDQIESNRIKSNRIERQ